MKAVGLRPKLLGVKGKKTTVEVAFVFSNPRWCGILTHQKLVLFNHLGPLHRGVWGFSISFGNDHSTGFPKTCPAEWFFETQRRHIDLWIHVTYCVYINRQYSCLMIKPFHHIAIPVVFISMFFSNMVCSPSSIHAKRCHIYTHEDGPIFKFKVFQIACIFNTCTCIRLSPTVFALMIFFGLSN